ncbi:PEP-CTERM sorting domain-containing protein [Geminisphaera colitermitum]|uniref:PEP-CTERM sorting domain-containing protein n=1 Tax=Geminisphaera colitermitum TaxID=1148786 RepID=UPI0001964E74|nr:PEP-CTERM sorting domain-containing protein [Geminisphaera colitermitum]
MKPEKTYPASRALASGLLAFALTVMSSPLGAAIKVWDLSDDAGAQNGDGVWNAANVNWTANASAGTVRTAWTSNADGAMFGGGGSSGPAGTPAGNFTVTIDASGVTAASVRQYKYTSSEVANYTLSGGTLTLTTADGVRADHGIMTINSNIVTSVTNMNLGAGELLVLGGSNTFGTQVSIGNGSNLGGTVKLANANALGTGTSVRMVGYQSGTPARTLDINGLTISGNSLTVVDGSRSENLISSSTTSNAVWAGNVTISNATSTLNAGATAAGRTLEISGIISGAGKLATLANSHLILSGASTYSGATTIAAGSTFELAATGSILFNLNAGKDGIVNVMTGTGTAILDGTFTLSFNLADVAEGASLAFLASDISATYGSSFTLRALDATLTKVAGAQNLWAGGGWIYDMGTGVFSRGVIPEPATTIALLGGAAILAASVLRRRK